MPLKKASQKKTTASKPKKFSTVNEAAYAASTKFPRATPQDEVWRGADKPNPFGKATKLKKAKGNPSVYTDGLGPDSKPRTKPTKKPKSISNKSAFKKPGRIV